MTPAMRDERARHDFKNQLAIIRGFAELLLADATESRQRLRRDLEEYKAAVSALELLDRLYPAAATEPGASTLADVDAASGMTPP
jgi:signal transduction histidine kinase